MFIIFDYIFIFSLKTPLKIDDKGERDYYRKADRVNYAFHPAAYWFAAYPLYHGEHHARPVERGKRNKVKHGKVYADKRADIQ